MDSFKGWWEASCFTPRGRAVETGHLARPSREKPVTPERQASLSAASPQDRAVTLDLYSPALRRLFWRVNDSEETPQATVSLCRAWAHFWLCQSSYHYAAWQRRAELWATGAVAVTIKHGTYRWFSMGTIPRPLPRGHPTLTHFHRHTREGDATCLLWVKARDTAQCPTDTGQRVTAGTTHAMSRWLSHTFVPEDSAVTPGLKQTHHRCPRARVAVL